MVLKSSTGKDFYIGDTAITGDQPIISTSNNTGPIIVNPYSSSGDIFIDAHENMIQFRKSQKEHALKRFSELSASQREKIIDTLIANELIHSMLDNGLIFYDGRTYSANDKLLSLVTVDELKATHAQLLIEEQICK